MANVNNTYNYDVNYLEPGGVVGVMTINDSDGNSDVLNLNGLTSNDVVCAKDGNDLIIRMIADPNKSITITDWFDGTDDHKIESIYFKDSNSTSGRLIVGTDFNDDIFALGGGNNTIKSGNGDDALFGSSGDDALNGEKGDDNLQGGLGNDTYVIDHQSGNSSATNNDTIYDTSDPEGTPVDAGVNDTVKFDLGLGNVTFSKDGDNLIAKLSSGETLTITNHFKDSGANNYYNRIENFEFQENGVAVVKSFEDIDIYISGTSENDMIIARWNDIVEVKGVNLIGTTGNDNLVGGVAGDTLFGGAGGNDSLNGGMGDDTYIFGINSGSDIIFDDYIDTPADAGVKDKVVFENLCASQVQLRQEGTNLIAKIESTGEELTIIDQFKDFGTNEFFRAIEEFQFKDGTYGLNNLRVNHFGEVGPEYVISGTSYSDVINGSVVDDIIKGLSGNDLLFGNEGNDRLYGGAGNDKLYGGAGNDIIWGEFNSNELYGEDGNDTLISGTGNDLMVGGAGDDRYIYLLGSGSDIIKEHNDTNIQPDWCDSLQINGLSGASTVDFDHIGNDLIIKLNGVQSLTIIDQFEASRVNRIENFKFTLGNQQLNFTSLYLDAIISEMSTADPSNEAPITVNEFMTNSAYSGLISLVTAPT